MAAKAGSCNEILRKFNGGKHLTVGNNDPETTPQSREGDSAQHYAELQQGGHHLILCHYAFRTWKQIGKQSIDLLGHSHGRLKPLPRQSTSELAHKGCVQSPSM